MLIGATAQIVDLNGVAKVSHIKDKLVKMAHLKEAIRSSSLALASAY